ncbi:MAG: hypothetical protein ACRERD_01210, partial [Candidatus Binatia bacterium]
MRAGKNRLLQFLLVFVVMTPVWGRCSNELWSTEDGWRWTAEDGWRKLPVVEESTPPVTTDLASPPVTTNATPTMSEEISAAADAPVPVTTNEGIQSPTVLPGDAATLDSPDPLPQENPDTSLRLADAADTDTAGSSEGATQPPAVGDSEGLAQADEQEADDLPAATPTPTPRDSGRLPRRSLGAPERYEPAPLEEAADADFQAVTDRWRIVPPPYEVNVSRDRLWDPYN